MTTTVTQEELARRMKVDTLVPETPDLRAEAEKRLAGTAQPDGRTNKVHTFHFRYVSAGSGKVWDGPFTNHVLTLRERQLVGIMRARLGGGLPVEALDPLTAEINLMLAHLEVSLDNRPDWAKNLAQMEDLGLVQSLYAEVAAHEATFLGWGKVAGTGEGQPG